MLLLRKKNLCVIFVVVQVHEHFICLIHANVDLKYLSIEKKKLCIEKNSTHKQLDKCWKSLIFFNCYSIKYSVCKELVFCRTIQLYMCKYMNIKYYIKWIHKKLNSPQYWKNINNTVKKQQQHSVFGDKAPKITAYFKHLVRLLRYVKKYIKLEYYDNVFLWSLSHTLALCSGVRQGLITFSMFSTLLLKRSRSLAICSQQEPSRASLLAKLQATRWCTVTSSLKHTWNKTKDKSMLTFFFF